MRLSLISPAALIALVWGCTLNPGPDYGVYDPVESVNRRSYAISEALDRGVLRPLAVGYRKVMPTFAEDAVESFFTNLRSTESALSGFLQGAPGRGFRDIGRFLVNSTLGIGGLFDVATALGIEPQGEDLGQVLASWGYTRSRYLYVPVLGPTTVRDLSHLIVRASLPRLVMRENYNAWVGSIDLASARAEVLMITDVRDEASLDPYTFTREAFYQRRRDAVFNGDPPVEDGFDLLLEDFDEEY